MVGAAVKAGPGPEALEGAGTIKPKGLSQRFEGEEGDRQIRCLQHNPELSVRFTAHTKASQNSTCPRAT